MLLFVYICLCVSFIYLFSVFFFFFLIVFRFTPELNNKNKELHIRDELKNNILKLPIKRKQNSSMLPQNLDRRKINSKLIIQKKTRHWTSQISSYPHPLLHEGTRNTNTTWGKDMDTKYCFCQIL